MVSLENSKKLCFIGLSGKPAFPHLESEKCSGNLNKPIFLYVAGQCCVKLRTGSPASLQDNDPLSGLSPCRDSGSGYYIGNRVAHK